MRRTFQYVMVVVAIGLATASLRELAAQHAQAPPMTLSLVSQVRPVPRPARPARLLDATDLLYVGAFRVPSTVPGSAYGFAYAGGSLGTYGIAVRVHRDGRRSLILGGHPYENRVAEIEVPATLSTSTSLEALPTARLLQPLVDVTEGQLNRIGADGAEYPTTVVLGGLLVYGERLVGTSYGYYDAAALGVRSHWTSGLSFAAAGDFGGVYRVGTTMPGFVSGYMAPVPPEWQAALGGPVFTGLCCAAIISRTSLGPALSTFDPNTLGTIEPTPARWLLGYPLDHPSLGTWGQGNPIDHRVYNMGVDIRGVVLPSGTRSVLFFGKTCTQAYYVPGGVRCDGPLPYVWAYDANDLAAVGRGKRQPWDPKPYATWIFTPTFQGPSGHIQGVGYDVATGLLYISASLADSERPVVHVYRIADD